MACNPCPCGNFHPHADRNSATASSPRGATTGRSSPGPITDRVDITRHVEPVSPHERDDRFAARETSDVVRARVAEPGCGRPSGTPAAAGGSTPRRPGPSCSGSGRSPPICSSGSTTRSTPAGSPVAARPACTGSPGRSRTSTGSMRPASPQLDAALRLRTGRAAARRVPAREGRRMTAADEQDRLARVALGTLGEPGDPRLVSLVAELGRGRGARPAGGRARPRRPVLDDVAVRLAATDPERDLERAAAARHQVRRARRRRVADPGRPAVRGRDPQRARRAAARAVGPRPDAPRRARSVGRRRRLAVGHHATARPSPARSAPSWRERATPSSRARPSASTRRPTGARWPPAAARSRCSPAASTVPTPPPTARCSTTSRETCAVVSELAPGRSPTRVRFLSRNRLIAALTSGTVVVEAAAAQRGAQHRRLGGPAPPTADGGAGAGHGRPVRGRPPAGPQGRRHPGDPWGGGARAGRAERASTSWSRRRGRVLRPRPSAAPRPAGARRRAGPPCRRRRLDRPHRGHRAPGHPMRRCDASSGPASSCKTSDGWRIRDANAADSPAESAEVPTMSP